MPTLGAKESTSTSDVYWERKLKSNPFQTAGPLSSSSAPFADLTRLD